MGTWAGSERNRDSLEYYWQTAATVQIQPVLLLPAVRPEAASCRGEDDEGEANAHNNARSCEKKRRSIQCPGRRGLDRRDRRGSRRKMIPYARNREKKREASGTATGATATATSSPPDTTLNLQPGHVVRQGGMAWQSMHIQAYSVVKASYYCAETSYPRTGTNVNDMLCRKRAEARTVWKKSKWLASSQSRTRSLALACRHRDTRPRLSSTCSASNEANCARRRGNHHHSSEARAV